VEDWRGELYDALKAQYLTNHFTRMWTRFNFFLTIESALFVFSLDQSRAAYIR